MFPASTTQAVADVVAIYRRCRQAGKPVELEAKLGRVEAERYVPHVLPTVFASVEKKLSSNPPLVSADEADEHVDVFFESKQGKKGQEVRMRIEFDSDDMLVRRSAVRKKKVAEALVRSGEAAIKVSVSAESPHDLEKEGEIVRPSHVRMKQRRAFLYPVSSPSWRYDTTRCWAGGSKTEAEALRRSEREGERGGMLEVEVELVSDSYLATRTDETVALSLLMKANDFLCCAPHSFGVWRG